MMRKILGFVVILIISVLFCDDVIIYQKPEGGVVWVGMTGGQGTKYFLRGYEADTGEFHTEVEITQFIEDEFSHLDYYFKINPNDNTIWLAIDNKLIKLSPMGDGMGILEFDNGQYNGIKCIDFDVNNDCCLISVYNMGVLKISCDDMSTLCEYTGDWRPCQLSVNKNTGDCWVIDNYEVIKLSPKCEKLLEYDGCSNPEDIAVDKRDGSVWIADVYTESIMKISSEGELEFIIDDLDFDYVSNEEEILCVNQNDGSCYVINTDSHADGHLRKYSCEGELLFDFEHYYRFLDVEVNHNDDTVWAQDHWGELRKLSSDLIEEILVIDIWASYVDVNE